MRQGQSLVMTPQLSQSIKLLALSNIELAAFVEGEMERNPFLDNEAPEVDTNASGTNNTDLSEQPKDLTGNTELETSARSLSENLGTSIENVYPDEQDYKAGADGKCKVQGRN